MAAATLALVCLFTSSTRAQSPASTNKPLDSLFLRDGDMLYGKLLAIDPDQSIHWQHPDASEAIEFKPDVIAKIEFSPLKTTAIQSNS
ncbi:MAG TPA: hypothetical protein VHZ30_03195, partial [Verrucomicrobiae bacterium]|nr:hypothetical protein [Verrucomicrobiae bacterium]